MDVPYRIPVRVLSGSAALASPALPSALRSGSDTSATSASGSCGVVPGPLPSRIVVIFSASSIGDLLYDVRKRLVPPRSLIFSDFAMQRFTVLAVRGGGTDPALMRPMKASPGVKDVFEGIAPSSA